MGHWAATTLGNDLAWDVLAELRDTADPGQVVRVIEGGLAVPAAAVLDEFAAPRALALAEAVAGGLGRPSPELPDPARAWCADHAVLLGEFRHEARQALAAARGGPYGAGWLREGGDARFAESLASLELRLHEGPPPLPTAPVQDRLHRVLHGCLERRGWRGAGPGRWRRAAGADEDRIRLRWHGAADEGMAVALTVEKAFGAAQRELWQVLGRDGAPDLLPMLQLGLPRSAWAKVGHRGRLSLGPPKGTPTERGIWTVAGRLHRLVLRWGERQLGAFSGGSLGARVEDANMACIRRCCPARNLLGWLILAGESLPRDSAMSTVLRLAAERREQLARVEIRAPEQAAALRAELDQVVRHIDAKLHAPEARPPRPGPVGPG